VACLTLGLFVVGYVQLKVATNPSGGKMAETNQSNTFSILAIVLGGLALLIFPILFGPAAIVLGVVGLVKKERLAPIGLTVGILGMLLGMFIGALVGMAVFG
jgi:hypothetical protein